MRLTVFWKEKIMIEIIGEVGRPATEEEIKEYLNRKDEEHE